MSVNNIKNNNKIQKNSNNLNLTKLILKNNEVIKNFLKNIWRFIMMKKRSLWMIIKL